MNKMTRSASIIRRILTVLLWVMAIVVGLAILAVLWAMFSASDSIMQQAQVSLTMGNYKLSLTDHYTSQHLQNLLGITLANLVIFGIGTCWTLLILRKMFAPIAQGSPFHATVSKSLRKLAYVTLLFGFLDLILQGITNAIWYRTFDIPSLFASDRVASCSLRVVGDAGFVGIFILLLLLSWIFKYGEGLQKLSDETL